MLVDSIHPEEPDLLVLGFQEVDLSTEALLYSTGTAKEDAWCMAVFAALGEKADWYEKASHKYSLARLRRCADCKTAGFEAARWHAHRRDCEEITQVVFFGHSDVWSWCRNNGCHGTAEGIQCSGRKLKYSLPV